MTNKSFGEELDGDEKDGEGDDSTRGLDEWE